MNLRVALSTTFFILKLIFRLPGMIISYYLRRRSATGRFRRELVARGVPPSEAKELGKMYPFKLGDVITVARGFSRS
jgi:hypothetical protein